MACYNRPGDGQFGCRMAQVMEGRCVAYLQHQATFWTTLLLHATRAWPVAIAARVPARKPVLQGLFMFKVMSKAASFSKYSPGHVTS